MHKAYQATVLLLSLAAVASFIGCFVANLELLPFLDPEKVRRKTGSNGLWYFGSRVTPMEFYKEEGWSVWKVRDRFRIGVIVSVSLLAVTILIGVIGGVPL